MADHVVARGFMPLSIHLEYIRKMEITTCNRLGLETTRILTHYYAENLPGHCTNVRSSVRPKHEVLVYPISIRIRLNHCVAGSWIRYLLKVPGLNAGFVTTKPCSSLPLYVRTLSSWDARQTAGPYEPKGIRLDEININTMPPSHLPLPNNQRLFQILGKALSVIREASGYLSAPTRTCSRGFRVGYSLVVLAHVHCVNLPSNDMLDSFCSVSKCLTTMGVDV